MRPVDDPSMEWSPAGDPSLMGVPSCTTWNSGALIGAPILKWYLIRSAMLCMASTRVAMIAVTVIHMAVMCVSITRAATRVPTGPEGPAARPHISSTDQDPESPCDKKEGRAPNQHTPRLHLPPPVLRSIFNDCGTDSVATTSTTSTASTTASTSTTASSSATASATSRATTSSHTSTAATHSHATATHAASHTPHAMPHS